MSKVFILGNGESRKNIDLDKVKEHGNIYGCNALYRDYSPHALVCVDGGMMHEVYSSGYCLDNKCYFRSWSKLPEFFHDEIIQGLDHNFQEWGGGFLIENEKGNRTQFVVNGTDPAQMKRLYDHLIEQGKDKDYLEQFLTKHHQWVTWVEEEDKVEIIPEKWQGWSAGPIAVRIALEEENPDEVYLIGFDLTSVDGKVNNVYKDTGNYLTGDAPVTPATNWIKQHAVNFRDYPSVKFYKVNTPELNLHVEEWSEFENVEYVLQKDIDV
jgi:hypothetical protein